MTMKFLSVPFVLLPRGAFLLVCAVLMLGTPPAKAQKAPPRAVPVEDPPVLPKAVPVDPKDLPKGVVPPRAQAVVEDTAPKGPDQDLFDYAMLAFSQKDYAIASQSFGKYLQSYP
ncbi:MAG: Tetratricopeptide repeat-containing protein, partial [Verrucomicrobiaceae bacterium]|nr:Tetratricopeptide repeat-containing protein [Verrucomicrobiaceae bacterium]